MQEEQKVQVAPESVVNIPISFYCSLINNNRTILQTGQLNLFIKQEGDNHILEIKIGHFIYAVDKSWYFLKREYEYAAGYYLIDLEGNLTCMVLEKSNPNKVNFQGYLEQFTTSIDNLQIGNNDRVKNILEKHWKLFETKAPVTPDGFQKFISSAGHVVGKGIASMGLRISGYFNQNNENNEILNVQQQPSWFDRFKQKTGNFLDKAGSAISSFVNPVIKKGLQANQKLGEKIDQGNNETMKYIKDVTSISSQAVKNIYLGAKAAVTGKDTLIPQENIRSRLNPEQSNQQVALSEDLSGVNLLSTTTVNDQLLEK